VEGGRHELRVLAVLQEAPGRGEQPRGRRGRGGRRQARRVPLGRESLRELLVQLRTRDLRRQPRGLGARGGGEAARGRRGGGRAAEGLTATRVPRPTCGAPFRWPTKYL